MTPEQIASMNEQLFENARQFSVPDSDSTLLKTEQLRARADAAYEALRLGVPPVRNDGEDLRVFRRRLLEPVRQFSPTWRGVGAETVAKLSRDNLAFDNLESQVYREGIQSGLTPRQGELRKIVSPPDAAGRRITRFIGDPAVTWAPFKSAHRHVTGIGNKG